MTIALRDPIATDYDAIASWVPDVKTCLHWAGPRLRFPFTAAELPRLLAVDDTESFTLTDGTPVPLGFGQLWLRDGDAVRLMRIIVAPPLRRLGLGRELCRLLIARAREVIGAPSVTLAVYRDNAGALALYRDLGFEVIESRSTQESLLMQLALRSRLP
ncbi:MAG TPA: N-acetyltransferase [Gammaproteobacteria bacterium]|nr:N-acetyltransferase [Gammaproteobacteria bacterium]